MNREPDNNDAATALWGSIVALLIVVSWAIHNAATLPGGWNY